MSFASLGLSEALLRHVSELGWSEPTPIQAQAIPEALQGRDVLGIAQTGTGKTGAFALPVLQRLTPPAPGKRPIRALILAPTRELAAQIGETFAALGKATGHRTGVIFGGVGFDAQRKALAAGLDILAATPGRLLDLMGEGAVTLSGLEVFILDEADRMLDMGFVHDVKKVIAKLPAKRQTMLFSATMPPAIVELSRTILTSPVRVEVTPQATTVERIRQHLLFVSKDDKRQLLAHVLNRPAVERAIVFTRTKHGANRVVEHLEKDGIQAAAIHGNKSQSARERALGGFKDGSLRVLVATDIAARGIDVDDITHVINYDLPDVPEQYVHRIGRTARAGGSGVALSFCEAEDRDYLQQIEKLIRQPLPVVTQHPWHATFGSHEPSKRPPPGADRQRRGDRPGGGRPGGGGGGGRGGGGGGRGGRPGGDRRR